MFRLIVIFLSLATLIGCGGVTVTPNPDPMEVVFQVTAKGKPVDDLMLVLLALDEKGAQAQGEIAKGKAKLSVYPGKYTYFVTEGKTDTNFRKIPSAYHAGAMDRTIEVKSADPVELKLD